MEGISGLGVARIPPHNSDAERSVLGSMIKNSEALMLAQEMLRADDFYDPANAAIFSTMLALSAGNQPVDLVTLDDALARAGLLDGVGGINYLIELTGFVPTTANIAAYIRIVEQNSTLRKLIAASDRIMHESYGGERPVPDILALAEKSIYDITMRKAGEALVPIQPELIKTFSLIERLVTLKGRPDGVLTGYYDLDNLLTGLHPGELVLIAARPSMGKTSMGMNIVENAALKQGKNVAVFSLEMPTEQLVMRMMCSTALVNLQNVRHGKLNDDDWERLTLAMGQLAQSHVFMDCTPGITVPEMRSRCRRLMMEHGLDLVVVDYIQLMTGATRAGSRQEEVAGISRMLKGLAQELHVPLIAMSQLSRAPQGRSNHRPVLSDLRDSGAIEQDADVVMFIHREEYYNPDTDQRNMAEIIVSKQRNGPLDTVKLAWRGEFTRFDSLSRRDA